MPGCVTVLLIEPQITLFFVMPLRVPACKGICPSIISMTGNFANNISQMMLLI